ncbi:PREDICTED: uncharacterized protein LOC102008193 isoform X1 [Chinchilla lanigera]|uniref:uncharacterized protein LOC102008193 isoform X1 n=1 Tax=Chinchilla lanigera TaxID=34839 RepID=UPI00038F1435|nr:PREDICTED: uncharacterized protein LOC102008193 isoform X1 [Chinchilla lanigera]
MWLEGVPSCVRGVCLELPRCASLLSRDACALPGWGRPSVDREYLGMPREGHQRSRAARHDPVGRGGSAGLLALRYPAAVSGVAFPPETHQELAGKGWLWGSSAAAVFPDPRRPLAAPSSSCLPGAARAHLPGSEVVMSGHVAHVTLPGAASQELSENSQPLGPALLAWSSLPSAHAQKWMYWKIAASAFLFPTSAPGTYLGLQLCEQSSSLCKASSSCPSPGSPRGPGRLRAGLC